MVLTHPPPEPDATVNRPIARHGRKPDLMLAIAMIEMRLLELPANSLRRQTLEQMIAGVGD